MGYGSTDLFLEAPCGPVRSPSKCRVRRIRVLKNLPAARIRHPFPWWSGEMTCGHKDRRPPRVSRRHALFPRSSPARSVFLALPQHRTGSTGRRPQAASRVWISIVAKRPRRTRFEILSKMSKPGHGWQSFPDFPGLSNGGDPSAAARLEFIDCGGHPRAPPGQISPIFVFPPSDALQTCRGSSWKTRNCPQVHAAAVVRDPFRDLGRWVDLSWVEGASRSGEDRRDIHSTAPRMEMKLTRLGLIHALASQARTRHRPSSTPVPGQGPVATNPGGSAIQYRRSISKPEESTPMLATASPVAKRAPTQFHRNRT